MSRIKCLFFFLLVFAASALFAPTTFLAYADSQWQNKGPAGGGIRVDRILIDPKTNITYAFTTIPYPISGSQYTIYVSFNSGESWSREIAPSIQLNAPLYPNDGSGSGVLDLKVSPVNSNIFFLSGIQIINDVNIFGLYKNDGHLIGGWTKLFDNTGPGYEFHCSSIGICTGSPEVMYAGRNLTGVLNGDSGALIMSSDSGESWTEKQSEFPFPNPTSPGTLPGAITALDVSPNDPKRIIFSLYCAAIAAPTEEGLYISTNEGATYTQTKIASMEGPTSSSIGLITIRRGTYPAGEVNAYAFKYGQQEGSSTNSLFRSTDEGQTWEEKPYNGFGNNNDMTNIFNFSVCSKDFKTIYVLTSLSLHKSTDEGNSWQVKTNGLPGGAKQYLIVDPNNPDVAFVGTRSSGIYRTIDGGTSWQPKNTGIESGKIFDISISGKQPSHIVMANNSGPNNFRISTNYAESWGPAPTNIRNVSKISYDQNATGEIYSQAQIGTAGFFKSTDEGQTWERLDNSFNLVTGESFYQNFAFSISEASREIFAQVASFEPGYGATALICGRVFKSSDGGESFASLTTLASHEVGTIIVTDPISKEILYIGGNTATMHGLLKSSNSGASFTDITPSGMEYVNDIAIDPVDSNIIYVACGSAEGAGKLWKSASGGSAWSTSFTPPSGYVEQIEVSRSNPNILYASVLIDDLTGGGIYKSPNKGAAWSEVSGTGANSIPTGTPIYILGVDPQSHVLVYAGTNNGVYKGLVDVPAPSPESIVPVSGSQFFPTAVTISGNYFFNLSRVYLTKGADTWDLAISSYTPISIEAIVPAGAVPGTYEVKVVGAFGASTLGPTFEVLAADINGPVISKVKFDGRYYYANCPISKSPLITAIVTDEDNVSPESFALLLYNRSDSSIRSIPCPQAHPATFPTTEMVYSYKIGSGGEPALSDGTYDFYIAAKDMASPFEHDGAWLGQVRVWGGTVKTIGDLLAYPTPFKPLSGQRLSIAYNLTQNAKVTMYVYDISGKVILTKKFGSGSQGGHAGYNEITWDGMTDFGKMAPNGIVVIKLTAGNKAIGTLKIPVID